MNNRTDLAGILEALRAGESIGVTTHVSPDGDAVGSMLATARLLRLLGKTDVVCILEDPTGHAYRWLPGANEVISPDGAGVRPDTLVLMDASRRDRLGRVARVLGPDTRLVVIDHHIESCPEGDVAFVDPSYAASGEIIAELFERSGVPLDPPAALCLYVAIATDTGGFRFASTNARSHRIAARILECKIDVAEISYRVFDAMTPAKFRLMTRLLARMKFVENARVAYSEIYPADLSETGAHAEDINNLVNLGRNVEGVQVAILFRSLDNGTTKISIRAAPTFNAARLAAAFGGGGHVGAAGATLAMSLDDARAAVLDRARNLLEQKK